MKQSTYIVTARVFGVTAALRFCMLLDHPNSAPARLIKRFGSRLVSCDSVRLDRQGINMPSTRETNKFALAEARS